MIFKFICEVTLFIADLVLTKWIPLKETIHYLNLQSAIVSQQESQVALREDGQSDSESLTEELIHLAQKCEERLQFLRRYWVFVAIVSYCTSLFASFPFVNEGKVMIFVLVSNLKNQREFQKEAIQNYQQNLRTIQCLKIKKIICGTWSLMMINLN